MLGLGDGNAFEFGGVGEEPAFEGQMVILDQLLTEDQPEMDIEVDQGAGGLVESEMTF